MVEVVRWRLVSSGPGPLGRVRGIGGEQEPIQAQTILAHPGGQGIEAAVVDG